MKKLVIKWGTLSGLFLIVTFLLTGLLRDQNNPNYDLGEIVGFTLIFIAYGLIFLGIKAYRDQNSGVISFITAFKMGLLIAIFPTVAFVIYNWVYVTYIDPDFTETYYAAQLEKAKTEMDAIEYEAYAEQTAQQVEMFSSPAMQAIIYLTTNYLIGVVLSLIAALIMRRKYQADVVVS